MKSWSCVIIDGDGPGETARHLAVELERRGHRTAMLGADLDVRDFIELSALVRPQRVVFAPPARDECVVLNLHLAGGVPGRLAPLVAAGVKRFLGLTQAAIRELMVTGGGQIWVADWDDTFEYHLQLPCAPLQAEARAAAVRSMSKECACLGIKVNSISVQPVAEMFPPEQFRDARDDLKTYALRYKPVSCAAVASQVCDFLEQPDLPMAGAMVGLGTGVCQGHLIQ
jgi:hypothetical protein